MARTTTTLVQALLGANYGKLPSGALPDLQQYIDSATVIVDRVATCANRKGLALTTTELELIERWLSGYFYCKMDPLYASRSTAGASGNFVTSQSLEGEQERYKRGAIEIDYSGCLNAILGRKLPSLAWLGKLPSEQIPYDQRD